MNLSKKGKVYIIGAGPGDPELITLRALNRIKIADVILYDRLVNQSILNYAPPNAKLIPVAKTPNQPSISQDEICKLMIKYALEGMQVVRLKGGDPFIFGRGAEEALEMSAHNIDFEIIPGITAGIGASAYTGIPLTHRNLVTQCIFITGHEASDKTSSQVDWKSIAKLKNTTIVIYMGAENIEYIAKSLIFAGLPENTPSAIIENATLNSQKTIITTLSNLKREYDLNNCKPPIITIISETIPISKNINWLEKKPLFGKKIIITRASTQLHSLKNLLENEGAIVFPFSTISIEPIYNIPKIKELFNTYNFNWIIFTSENGVNFFFNELQNQNTDVRILGKSKIAVIGPDTANALKSKSISPDFIPTKYTSSNLIEEFLKQENLHNQKILRIKGDFKEDYITKVLTENNIFVYPLEVYRITAPTPSLDNIKILLDTDFDAITFTSSSTVINFFEILKDNAYKKLENITIFSIGPQTTKKLNEYNIHRIIEAEESNINCLYKTIINFFKKDV